MSTPSPNYQWTTIKNYHIKSDVLQSWLVSRYEHYRDDNGILDIRVVVREPGRREVVVQLP